VAAELLVGHDSVDLHRRTVQQFRNAERRPSGIRFGEVPLVRSVHVLVGVEVYEVERQLKDVSSRAATPFEGRAEPIETQFGLFGW
jgi:hypothetical protein